MTLSTYISQLIKTKYHNGKSRKNITSLMNSFLRKFPQIKTIKDLSQQSENILKGLLKSTLSAETIRKIVYILSLVYDQIGDKKSQSLYQKTYLRLKKEIIDHRKTNKPISAKEADCVDIPYETLFSKPIDLKELDQKTLLYNLLIYIKETPRLDYRTLIYNPTKNKNVANYIKLNEPPQIVLNDYKTSKTYGPWIIPIKHNKLLEYLRTYVRAKNIKPGTYLFLNQAGKPYPSHKFSEYTQRMFNKKLKYKITMNCLRKIKEKFIFHNNPKTLNMSYKDKEDLVAKYFKHNLQTSMLYYNIVD